MYPFGCRYENGYPGVRSSRPAARGGAAGAAGGARQVDGIKGVKNLLHTPGTPTPQPEPRFLAAEHYHRS